MREAVRNYLNAEVTDWYQQGIIGQETRALLAERYDRPGSALSTLIKWLGFFAVYSLGSFVLTFVAAMAQSKTAAAVILFLAAGGSWHTGVRLVRRFPEESAQRRSFRKRGTPRAQTLRGVDVHH